MIDKKYWEYLKEGILNFIFPLVCENCGTLIKESKGYSICDQCFQEIKIISPPYCYQCGKPFSPGVDFEKEALCADCIHSKEHFYFIRNVAYYQGVLRKCIHLLKYKKQVKLVQPLANLMVNYLEKNKLIDIKRIDLIISVPLFRDDYWKRGFNQSSLLAKHIANYFSISFAEDLLLKIKGNLSQVGLSKAERKINVKGVYALNSSFPINNISRLLLIDDIYTTGATIEACCQELRKAALKEIYVLTLARGL